ncbi:MAG: gamma-glutamylcyclotransferase [Alphaproteobacteria bacterium]
MAKHPWAKDRWVFGYASLMWLPGFEPAERLPGMVRGWRRDFTLMSTIAWGSPERPGLCAALHPGGACLGAALRVRAADWSKVEAYLRVREQAYRWIEVPVSVPGGQVLATTFAFDPDHPRAVGRLPFEETVRLIGQGAGRNGTSRDYLANTLAAVVELGGGRNRYLQRVHRAVGALSNDGNIC